MCGAFIPCAPTTFLEAKADLISFLVNDCGIRLELEPPAIEGEAEKGTNGVARIGAKTGGPSR